MTDRKSDVKFLYMYVNVRKIHLRLLTGSTTRCIKNIEKRN